MLFVRRYRVIRLFRVVIRFHLAIRPVRLVRLVADVAVLVSMVLVFLLLHRRPGRGLLREVPFFLRTGCNPWSSHTVDPSSATSDFRGGLNVVANRESLVRQTVLPGELVRSLLVGFDFRGFGVRWDQ